MSETILPGEPNVERYFRIRSRMESVFDILDIRTENIDILAEVNQQYEGAILAPTHTSWIDIVALGAVNDVRLMRFMAKEEVFTKPYIGGLAVDAGAYPVNRGDDTSKRQALDKAVSLLDEGEWTVIYPEGTRNRSKDPKSVNQLRTGAVRAAYHAKGDTPVVPIGIGYRGRLIPQPLRIKSVGVVVGDPIIIGHNAPANKQDVKNSNDQLYEQLVDLKFRAVDLARG